MAHPIKATPTLNREQTVRFVNRLLEGQDKKKVIDLNNSVKIARIKRGIAKVSGGII